MDLLPSIKKELRESREVLERFTADENNTGLIAQSAVLMADCLSSGGKIISCGNGGSHCDAMHFAEELTGRYRQNRLPMAALVLSDAAHLSCVANDFGYSEVFSRAVQALGRPGDILLAFSTSGESENILQAARAARAAGMGVIVLTGNDGGRLKPLADIAISVNHGGYADRIQEIHIKVIHCLVFCLERLLFNQIKPTDESS